MRDGERPVIVSLSLEGTELSNVRADKVLDALARSGAILHAVSIGKPTLKTMTPWSQQPTQSLHENLDENINRHAVLADGPRRSGGRLEQVVEVTGLPARLSQIAYELVDQLVVTYASPPAGGGRIEVDTTRRGVKLRAPQRTRQR
jgi:hypothetical protein